MGEKKGEVLLVKSCWEWFAPRKTALCENKNSRQSQLWQYLGFSQIARVPSDELSLTKEMLWYLSLVSAVREISEFLLNLYSFQHSSMWHIWKSLSSGHWLDCWELLSILFNWETCQLKTWSFEDKLPPTTPLSYWTRGILFNSNDYHRHCWSTIKQMLDFD